MSDRFKLRVWDNQEKLYIENIGIWGDCWLAHDVDLPENYYDTFDNTPDIVSGFDDSICVVITDRFVVEQCIGLKDRNGTLIFEGDIVSGSNGSMNGHKWPFECKIKWTVGKFYFPEWAYDKDGNYDEDSTHYVEKVGNIHEVLK